MQTDPTRIYGSVNLLPKSPRPTPCGLAKHQVKPLLLYEPFGTAVPACTCKHWPR